MENVKEVIFQTNLSYKVGCDSSSSEQVSVKLEDDLNQVACYDDGQRNDIVTPDPECDTSIKQEIVVTDVLEVEIEEHHVTEENAEENLRLDDHVQLASDGGAFQCQLCGYQTKYKQNVRQHIRLIHDENAILYQCRFCEYKTKSKGQLKQHFSARHDREVELHRCQFCEYKTKRQRNLRQHFKAKHDEKAKWHQCQACDYRTKCERNSKLHFKTKHNNLSYKVGYGSNSSEQVIVKLEDDLNQVACNDDGQRNDTVTPDPECDISIKQEIDVTDVLEVEIEEHAEDGLRLEDHVQLASDGVAFQCQFCGYQSKHKQNVRQHIRLIHDENAILYQCRFCEYKTKSKGHLKQHFSARHDREVEWHRCQFCEYKTKRQRNLRQHFKAKHDEKAEWHQCQACDYRTKCERNFKLHFKTKHDEDVIWYQCQACNYKTKDKSNMRKHTIARHDKQTGQHECQTCEFKTKLKYMLTRHLRRMNHIEKTEKD